MIEWRAVLRKNKKFEGGFRLESGTFIYVRELKSGWIGTYYEPKGTAHSFAIDTEDFSILRSADCEVEQLVMMPDPPEPPEKVEKEQELARKRIEYQIKRHRQAANELAKLLKEQQ